MTPIRLCPRRIYRGADKIFIFILNIYVSDITLAEDFRRAVFI